MYARLYGKTMKDIEKKINDILTRGVGEFIDPQGEFKKKLLEQADKKAKGENFDPLIIKFGIDPTRPDIHLGHAVVLRKLRQMQDLGCKVIFLIGDITATIGDPTGKDELRPQIEQEKINANMLTYHKQVGKMLLTDDLSKYDWINNSEWFLGVADMFLKKDDGNPANFDAKAELFRVTRKQANMGNGKILGITLRGVLWTLGRITHSQLINRDMFQERLKKGSPLYMHEMLYPVLQGMDSFAIYNIYGGCDMEIGGTDQTFNMLMGREIMKMNNQPEQAVMSLEILVGLDGKEKMSKSLHNYVGIIDEPNDMFESIMIIPDGSIVSYYELCTIETEEKIKEIREKLTDSKINPRDVKMRLALEITKIYHGEDKALTAQNNFVNTFQKKEIPEEMDEIKASVGELLVDALLRAEVVSSKTNFRQLVEEGAVKRLDPEEKITDFKSDATKGVYKIGKKRFMKII